MSEVSLYASEGTVRLLVGNKSDLEGDREVSFETGKAYADQEGIPFIEASAKSSRNVEQAFLTMTSQLIRMNDTSNKRGTGNVNLQSSPAPSSSEGGCCK